MSRSQSSRIFAGWQFRTEKKPLSKRHTIKRFAVMSRLLDERCAKGRIHHTRPFILLDSKTDSFLDETLDWDIVITGNMGKIINEIDKRIT